MIRFKPVLSFLTLSLAIGHEDRFFDSYSASVPGPPEQATLKVIGSNTLQTTFAPPLWDGGSPITSYLVEWDKEATTPEVQRIVTSQNLNTNEVQTITTSTPDINEIQVIHTSATALAEVQAVTVSPPTGDASVDSAYSFALSLDTIATGGSQYSGQISANAEADGSRSSVAEIIENMANVYGRPSVERTGMNPDGGHTYLVTFPIAMGNVPEMTVLMSDLPVSVSTLHEGNQLEGSFRLEFMGELTADISFDASSSDMQRSLEDLDSIGAVSVTRSKADEQGGFSWEIEFVSDTNAGNVEPIVVHGDGLRTSNPIGGAHIENSGGRDGSYISGSFTLSFRGEMTNPISFDAESSTVKEELEALLTIERVSVERSPLDILGGCTWTISFLEDESRLHRGDMPLLQVESSLVGAPGQTPSIEVVEQRKGTKKEVQTISIEGGGGFVDPTSMFKLRFGDEVTGDIPALPIGGSTCLGSTKAKQIITTSSVDTSGVGGDDSLSRLTSFALTYDGYTTSKIMANADTCEVTSQTIARELMRLPPLYEVAVSGTDTGAGDEGCSWTVTFLSVMGNPELMTVTAFNSGISAGPGYSVTVGDSYSIIQDTVTITQPDDFKGDVNLIQSELSKLSSIGVVTVTPLSSVPDSFGQCTWRVTFESKAGNVPSIEVAKSGTVSFSSVAELNSGNKVIVTDDTVQGTSLPISGDFRLEFDGEVTGYMPFDASPEELKAALDGLGNIGHVVVTREGPDVNRCYTWDVTFVSDLGPLPLIVADDLDLKGTVASMTVSKAVVGALPPFNGPDYGSQVITITNTTDFSLNITPLKQGIAYYIRISAHSQMGAGPSIMPYPPFQVPLPQPPSYPSDVNLESVDGSTLAVSIHAPFNDGGEAVVTYRVDYSTKPFSHERQRISLTCTPQPEIQSITTSAADINEIQYLVIDSSYAGNGEVLEVQKVMCDATGGTFGLSLGGETAYISHDDDTHGIKQALEALPIIDEVTVNFNNGGFSACAPHDGTNAGDFSVTFQSLNGISGDLPLMSAETSGLDGARRVEVVPVIDGDAPLTGSLKLSFRGAMSEPVDVSMESSDVADMIDTVLEALDTVQRDGVVVTPITLENGGFEKIFRIEFQGDGVGGNVEPLVIVPEFLLVKGTSVDAFILSDGESYNARNGFDSVSSRVGNELSGHFRLKLRGHTTGRISFNSSVDQLKARLEELPNVGKVDVRMSAPSKEMAYTWFVTFVSNPGYFPPAARDVDLLEAISELSTSVETDTSAKVMVESIQNGDDRLTGEFLVSFNDGKTTETTRPLQSFISAYDLKMELEALANVGKVNVVRSQSLTGYEWDIEFTSCDLKNGLEVCNDGDLLDVSAFDISLQGCGSPKLAVVEIKAGSGPDACPNNANGVCSDEMSFDGEYPILHHIRGLALGVPYYVQARLRNSQSYGYRRLSNPPQASPKHNPPGPPPPVSLKESSSSSITVGWTKPKNHGGKAVSGYELWMDSWSGGDTFMVYDGAGNPDILEYRLTTEDVGPHSQVVETGRQYRFQVRAINNCDTDDPDRACYGEFSEVQIFTVRDPRPPLPPSIPRRDSRTSIISLSEASISISWSPPVDNGGSAITGYIVFMRDPDGTITSHAVGSETTIWQEEGLHPGEVYRFHVVAINAMGKSGNSPVLSALAAVTPGFNFVGQVKYSDFRYRPVIYDVHETSLIVQWSHVPADISGGSPITGFKLYMYKDVKALPQYDADPIRQEVQDITISSKSTVSGTFTLSFRGYETGDISVDATSNSVKMALQNLPSIGFVHVESVTNGWSVTFLSEAGDVPLMEATSGRLMGDATAKVEVAEATKGDPADLIYDGSETPSVLSFEALDLVPDLGYAFKVAPVNSVGDGILSAASIVAVARSGASASRTTASGSALFSGIAGSVREEQIVTFLSNDCDADKLILSFGFSEGTVNLCGSSEKEFQLAVRSLPDVGDVHVSREESSISGHVGYSWTVTFTSQTGDVPLLSVDLSQVGNGKDSFGNSGTKSQYVVEFLKGRANEFTIEPKKASGKVVKDLITHDGMEGRDIFFTELWTSDPSIIDGSHVWFSDGGVSSYNRLLYEEQVIAIPVSVGPFFLAMDTSEFQQGGRIDGVYSKTKTFLQAEEATVTSLQQALSELPNVLGQVDVTKINEDHESIAYFVVTFKDAYGEMPLISASDPSIIISRNGGQYSATEIQSITVSADKPFVYEVQSIIIPSSCSTFDLSFMSLKTNSISCNFADVSEARTAVSTLEDELNALSNIKVHVDTRVSGTGEADNPWEFKVTFIEPVGPLPLLNSGDVEILQVVQGESTLSGSFVLSYEGEYSADIPFDASARDVKSKLELLDTITEVNVKRIDKYTGYQWIISFTGNAGNLPPLIAHKNEFEVQSIEIVGGQPTPLGGSFRLTYLSESTSPLLHDSSAKMVKSSLEALRSINRVDVSHEVSKHGQSRWLVTFRSPTKPALLLIDSTDISGTLESSTVTVLVESKNPSLTAKSGSAPLIVIEEKIAGRPSYTGRYFANKSGSYTLAVMQLESGGLNARYYDNQWLLEEPVIERVDPTVSFDWGSGIITQYGRDFISVRWWGKVLPSTSELYTFYLLADDGVRLYVNHSLLIDSWDEHSVEKRATFSLTSGSFHDLKIEYKEITGTANIRLQWSSPSIEKQIIPPSQLYYTSHIVGSPFLTTVSPGAADYPYSGFIEVPGEDRSFAIAGDRTSFYLQARDSSGNKKLSNGDAQGDVQTPEEQFTVDIIGTHGSISGDVTYMSSGQYRVDFTILQAGKYQVYVKTGGTDIYCGLGEEQKCSPFTLTVLPGATLPSNCEAESSFDPVDNLVEARAGDIGKIYLQAKDAFGNNRISGEDDIIAKFKNLANSDIQYRAHILDRGNGSYVISYSIPLAGNYLVSIHVNGEPIKYCVGPIGERWDSRQYDGKRVYSSPSFCSLNDNLTLTVIHRDIHGLSSTLSNEPGSSGLFNAIVGVETLFLVESRDKFGNLRSGANTSNIAKNGDGMSDAFLATLVSPTGQTTITSSAIQTLTCSDSSVSGYFRLSFGGQVSSDIPHDISGPAMQVILSAMHEQHSREPIEVDRDDENGNYRWKITFKDNLDLWSSDPLIVLPGTDAFSAVSDLMTVTKDASSGVYPIRYKLWEKGTYELSVFSGATLVSGSTLSVEVTNGVPQASSSFAYGLGLQSGIAGEESFFEVQVRDRRQAEIQSIKASGTVIAFVNDIQRLQILSSAEDEFQLKFRGQETGAIKVGLSTLDYLEASLEALLSVGDVIVTSDGSSIIQTGDTVDVEFLTEHGNLDLMQSNSPEIITKLQEGEAPYRAERQSLFCDANGGYVVLSMNGLFVTIYFNDDIRTVESKISTIVGSEVSIVEVDESASSICNTVGKQVFIDFHVVLGDVSSIGINFDALLNGAMTIYGNGEGQYGAVNGISPITGHFTLTHDGMTTLPITVDASAADVKMALESLPSIGSISVTKDVIGIRQGSNGENLAPGKTSLFNIWSVTFAPDNQDGCHPGSWEKCPSNIGDVTNLEVDTSLVSFDSGATHQQSGPMIEVFEVRKGFSGNSIEDADDVEIDFSLLHNMLPGVGIGMAEIHELSCTYSETATSANNKNGSFELEILNKRITVNAQTSMSQLKSMIKQELNLVDPISTVGSSYGTVCRFNSNIPVTAVTKLSFSKRERAFPEFRVHSDENLIVTARKPLYKINGKLYQGRGLFQISYTPKISGRYSASIKVNDEFLWTDLSSEVTVNPTNASAQYCSHNAQVVAVAGAEQSFYVTPRDKFGNRMPFTSNETSVIVNLSGTPNKCNQNQKADTPVVTIAPAEIGSHDGHYMVAYTPSLAGQYQASVMLRSRGGLLATYYYDQDFSQHVYGNFNYNESSYRWCTRDDHCDSTLLDSKVSFSWGLESPLPSDPSFPRDSFSVMWTGELRADVSDEYTFIIKLNGGARLTIGGKVIIDGLAGINAESISSEPLSLLKGVFYPIKIEYTHFEEESYVHLLWESSLIGRQVVPSSVFYFTRHIDGSPFALQVLPGDIASSSVAQGDGLSKCVALQECTFTVYTKDRNHNNRFNDGTSPGFEISMVGSGGWAKEGRINSVTTYIPVFVSDLTVDSNDWDYIGHVDVTHLSNTVSSGVYMLGLLRRGDNVVIDGGIYTVSSTGKFDETSVELLSHYLGPTKSGVPLYKTSKKCMTGTHTIKYTPQVRGSYVIDVKLPEIKEVQRVSTFVSAGSSMSGAFTLQYGSLVSGNIGFDATSEELKFALELIEDIGTVDVTVHECSNPIVSCSWDITFLSNFGDIDMPLPIKNQLMGDGAEVLVVEVRKGARSSSINGFPRTIDVLPGETSPLLSTAYGTGLVKAIAGMESSFTIQPKDSFGNDRLALQSSNLFAVRIYPEECDEHESYSLIQGRVTRNQSGSYTVKYTPYRSGFHTIAVVMSISMEKQMITTGYNTKARGGSFTILLNKKPSLAIPWDTSEEHMEEILNLSFGSTSTFSVEKQSHGFFNFKYLLSFKTALGDVPALAVDTSNLIGNAEDWDVTTLVDGAFSHVKISNQERELQRITLDVVDSLSVDGATFSLAFMGRRTEPIPWDSDPGVMKTSLQKLATIGDIFVSLDVDGSTGSRTWLITFDPYEGRSSKSLNNFGNLPSIEALDIHDSISVSVNTVQNGRSPFRALVLPAEPSTHFTTAFDYANVENFGGLSTGTYKSPTHFFLQTRDSNSNKVNDGPLSDVQIIETLSSSNIGGSFEVSILGEKRRFASSTFLSEVEKELQSIPGIGSVTVSSNSAKDEVIGKTAAVTKGLNTIVPSAKLNEFIIGDWIRLGDQNSGQLFSIVALSEFPPYVVDLSSPYLGESEPAVAIFQHGSLQHRPGYQYIVTFDSVHGDFPKLLVNGAQLEGDQARVEVTSCDWNVSQNLRIDATGPAVVSGHFYLNYRGDQTRLLSVRVNAGELMDAIISDISSIHSLSVVDEQDYEFGGKSWTIHLQAFDDEAELFFAEGHLLHGGSIASTNHCPSASPTDPLYSVKSVAGRRGQEFVIALHGPTAVHGTVDHEKDGRYIATYASPRAGDYLLSVLGADVGGLTGEYFENRWLNGSPGTTRVDSVIDFEWSSSDPVISSGKDFVSIRWTGYIKPSFGEMYTFTVRVNDAVRLWIGDDLLIDEYDSEVNDQQEFAEFFATTTSALVANQLVDIKIEYRENRGAAMIRLFWESPSQPFATIDSYRLFYNASHVLGSPFSVSPQPIEPSSPVNCKLSIVAWDSLRINWSAPKDDGGADVTKYLVESWDANKYGLTEKQQLRLRRTITGGTFAVGLSLFVNAIANREFAIVPVDSTALEFERLLESLRIIGDAKVTKSLEVDFVVFDIEFLSDIAPVPVLSVDLASATPVTEQGEYCICAKGNIQCHSGSPTLSCDAASSIEGSVSTQRTEISVGSKISSDGIHFLHTINGLQQSSSITDGFGVRVSAGNTKGFGVPCQSTFLKPAGPPLPPALIELERAASNPSSLALHFTSVSYPEDRASIVTGFFIEWSTTQDFLDGTVSNATLKADEVTSERLPSYNNVNKVFNFYLLEDLTPGKAYFVRIAAINDAGRGPSAHSTPLSLAPGSKPSDLENKVILQTVREVDSSVSVMKSCSSLYVSWSAPARCNGFIVSKYLVEYWVSNGVSEVQEISILSSKTTPIRGTFTLGYGKEKTNSLSIDASVEDIKNELESLNSIRSVKVWRYGENPTYRWTVTFLSEFPSVSGNMLNIVEGYTQLMDSDGESPTLHVSVLTPASLPLGYSTEVIAVEDPVKTHYSLTLNNLTPGQSYTVQVSAANSLGFGYPQPSVPRELSPPIEKPSAPTNIILRALSQSLEVIFSKPQSNGGDAVTLYKIEWDASSDFDSNAGSPVGSYSFVSPKDDTGCDRCTYQISGLTNGMDYFVRVYAYNSRGYSMDPGLPTPLFLSPKRPPDPPAKVLVSPLSDTEIEVAFPPSSNDGGAPVTKYMIKWNAMGHLAGMAFANGDKQSSLYSAHNVQTITLTADSNDIGGSFRIGFEYHATEMISVKSTANDVKLALESLPTIGSTVVSRKILINGLMWSITFLSNVGDIDEFGPIPPLTVSIDSADLPDMFVTDTMGLSRTTTTLQGSGSRLVVNVELAAFKGFEQQMVTAQCASPQGILGGHFSLSFDGIRTNDLEFDVSALDLKKELEKINTIGAVKVVRQRVPNRINSFRWKVIFIERLGNVPLLEGHDQLTCSDGSGRPLIYTSEIAQGMLPRMNGPHAGLVEIDAPENVLDNKIVHKIGGLISGMSYHFQVFAWNGAGDSFGPSQYSTPAIVNPVDCPDPPSSIEMTSIDDTKFQVTWSNALGNGSSHQITKYKVELAERLLRESEIQKIHIAAADRIGGSFRLGFTDSWTPFIPVSVSAHQLKNAIDALPGIRDVIVNKLFLSANSTSWTVTFQMNIGDQPSLAIDSTKITGTQVSAAVVELTAGEDAFFDHSSDAYLGSFDVEYSPEVQTIVLKSSADDIGGYFSISFMGSRSRNIYIESTPSEVKETLEGISTIDIVDVSMSFNRYDPTESYGQRWIITFISQKGNLPSMLVDTGTAPPSTFATGGTLYGSSAIVLVETTSDGFLPRSFITPSTFQSDKIYISRVLASNGYAWGSTSTSQFAISPSKTTPSPPRDVRVIILSDTELGISWREPKFSGGDLVAGYKIQWDNDEIFDYSSATVSHRAGSEKYYFIIENLVPSESYFVRVIAYSAQGFSDPELAMPLLPSLQIIEISLVETTGLVDFSETFRVECKARITNPISVYATSHELENELNKLGMIVAISVDREDRSKTYDSSSIETNFFDIRYIITFTTNQDVTLKVDSHSLGSIVASVKQR